MRKNVIYFSHHLGQMNKGVSRNKDFIGNLIYSNNDYYNVRCSNNFYKNINNLYMKNQQIYGNRINIGGDHSMSISTVAHSLNNYNNLKVIWIDAHADINTYNKSLTKNYHGMPLSFLTGMDYNPKINFINNNLKFSNLLYIGLRDIDDFEMDILNKKKIKQITVEDIRNDYKNSLKKINRFIGSNHLHVSFDMDVLDPSIMPCTGLKVPNGLLLNEAQDLIHHFNKKKLVSMDISELNLDIGNIEEKIKSLHTFFKIFKKPLNLT